MHKNNSSLMSDKSKRIQSVERFNIRTLKTLHYYGGYSTTHTLSLVHHYSAAGIRKRMKAMVRQGWIEKVENDEGLGRKEQFWSITKAGRIAAHTENDPHVEAHKLKSYSICEYSPALHSHTQLVQVMANHLERSLEQTEIKPFKIEVKEKYKIGYIYPDIAFENGMQAYFDSEVSAIELYEVELTIKSINRYKELFRKISIHNIRNSLSDNGFVISHVIYITTPQLIKRLRSILKNIHTDFGIYIFDYKSVLSSEWDFDEGSFIKQPSLSKDQLYKLGRS